jgi:hypothetical protein
MADMEALRLAGFERVEELGERPYYLSPIPRIVLNKAKKVGQYLESQQRLGNLKEISLDMFTPWRASRRRSSA